MIRKYFVSFLQVLHVRVILSYLPTDSVDGLARNLKENKNKNLVKAPKLHMIGSGKPLATMNYVHTKGWI